MRTSIVLIAASAAVVLALAGVYAFKQNSSTIPAPVVESFATWRMTYGKSYGNPSELQYRTKVFYTNYQKVAEIKKSGVSYSVALNQFADMTEEEFVAKYTGYRHQERKSGLRKVRKATGKTLPDSVDWRKKGAVNPVRNQGRCGSCWAFAAVVGLEGAYYKSKGKLIQLSEQQLVDCSVSYGNHGCNGGLMDYAFEYIEVSGGLASQSDYPYTGKDGTCQTDVPQIKFKVSDYVDVHPRDADALAEALAQQPVSVAIAANSIMFYSGGVFDNRYCGSRLNHGVSAVGYGHDSTENKDYWIVRNSWGASWGEDGYIRMRKDVSLSTGECGILLAASYPEIA